MSTTTTRRTDGKRPLLPTTDILDRQPPAPTDGGEKFRKFLEELE